VPGPETIPGPTQLKPAFAVVEVALTVPLNIIQFNVKGLPAVILGILLSEVTITVAVLVQPFTGSVTVTV
jgi:hypothetical protein